MARTGYRGDRTGLVRVPLGQVDGAGRRGRRDLSAMVSGPRPARTTAESLRPGSQVNLVMRTFPPTGTGPPPVSLYDGSMASVGMRKISSCTARVPGRQSEGSPWTTSSEEVPYHTSPGRQSQLIGAHRSSSGNLGVRRTSTLPSSSAVRTSPESVRTKVGPFHTTHPRRS